MSLIRTKMYERRLFSSECGGKHNKAHIHATYGNEEIVVSTAGEVLEGSFPNKQLKLLLAWMTIHEEELNDNWKMISNGEGFLRLNH